MSFLNDRRGFLRGLVSLPLIGGGISLIGSPIAVAEPVSLDLLQNYNQWLWGEHTRCAREIEQRFDLADVRFTHEFNAGRDFHRDRNGNWDPGIPPASTRAAVVLSAVGINWREVRT